MKKLSSIAELGSKFMAASAPVKAVVVVGTVVVVGGGTYGGVQIYHHVHDEPKELVLLQDEIDLEYGIVLSEEAKDYVDVDKSNQEMLEKAIVDLSNVTMNEDGYAEVGEYVIKIVSGDKEYSIDLAVADTVAPTFKDGISEIKTAYASVPDYLSMFKAEDGSDFEITVDDSSVNYEKAGTYTIKVSAKDKYGNESILDNISVIVEEKEVAATNPSDNAGNTGGNSSNQTPNNSGNSNSSSSGSSGSNSGNSSSSGNNGSNNQGSSSEEKPTTPPDSGEQEPNNCPYELYVITKWNGHYGFFTNGDGARESALIPTLYPEGGEGKSLYVGTYDDVGGVSFLYNDEHPDNK